MIRKFVARLFGRSSPDRELAGADPEIYVLDDARREMIGANCALVISEMGKLRGEPLGFDRDSVAWVEGFIERQHQGGVADKDGTSGLASTLGCYLGEAIIANAGGRWSSTEQGELGIHFDNENWCFPISKVSKQLSDGLSAGESILSFYDVSTTVVAKGGIEQPL